MSEPITFPSSTPALGLPLLIAGQAQKEFFVNQALSLIDSLHARSITASLPVPPASTSDGESFRVTAPATGAWAGHEGEIAVRIAGAWHFVPPAEGIRLFDRGAGHMLVFRSQWISASAPASPSGGTVVDAEVRAGLAALIQAMMAIGILGAPAT